MVNTKVTLCGIEMDNPIIPASGTFGFGYEFAELYDINMLGTFSFKGTTREPRFGNPTPRIAEYAGGLLNAVGLQNPGVDAVIETELPKLQQVFHKPVMANISGFSVAEYAEVCEKLDAQEQVGWLEVNISCPNVHGGGMSFGTDPKAAASVTRAVKDAVKKPVIVMEPVKGGNLVNLPEDAKAVLEDLHGGSPVSYAIRFVAGFPGMMMVLSGMSNMEQMQDNISFMRDFKPLDETERAAVEKVQEIFHSKDLIPCTACRYCTDGCPKHISIPDLFAIMNTKQIHHDWNADCYYEDVHTAPGRKASDCLKCGKCEKVCPQHLPIRKLLEQVAAEFEKAPAAN